MLKSYSYYIIQIVTRIIIFVVFGEKGIQLPVIKDVAYTNPTLNLLQVSGFAFNLNVWSLHLIVGTMQRKQACCLLFCFAFTPGQHTIYINQLLSS
jgi:hypothetical protein